MFKLSFLLFLGVGQKVEPVITGTPPRDCVRNFIIMNTRPPGVHCRLQVRTLLPVRSAAADARAWCREVMKEWQLEDVTDVVRQLASELVSNSVEHARTSSVRVLLMRADDLLRLDVSDDDVASVPVRTRPSVDDLSGRGLAIVEALADRWGIHVARDAKTVWCELDCESDSARQWRL